MTTRLDLIGNRSNFNYCIEDFAMPLARRVLNAFTAREVGDITGLSLPMINYLRREDMLVPSYGEGEGRRGRVRYYSYRDLVVAKLIQSLREAGVELSAIKKAIDCLREDRTWERSPESVPELLRFIYTDGRNVFLQTNGGTLEHLRADRQRAFAFVVHVGNLVAQVKASIPSRKRGNFALRNHPLLQDRHQA